MSSKWAFIGGILAGIAGVFTAVAVSVEFKKQKNADVTLRENRKHWPCPKSKAGKNHS